MAEVADAPVAAAHGVGRLRLTGSPEHERSQIFVGAQRGRDLHPDVQPQGRRQERDPDRQGLLWRAPSLRAEPECRHEGVREEAVGRRS